MKLFDEETIVIIQGGGGGDTDVDFIDSFDLVDVLAATLGPFNVFDTFDLGDVPKVGPIALGDSVAISDAPSLWTVQASVPDSLDLADAHTTRATLPDGFDVADAFAAATSKVADSVAVGDNLAVARSVVADSIDLGDKASAFRVGAFADSIAASDALPLTRLRADDSAAISDALTPQVTITPFADSTAFNDASKAAITTTSVARSGTPSTDFLQDTCVKQPNPTVNFGSDAAFTVSADGALNDSGRIGYVEIDLTKLAGVVGDTAAAFGMRVSLVVSHGGVVASPFLVSIGHIATKPFVEDTVTWNTGRPTEQTQFANRVSRSIPNGAAQTQNWTLTAAQLDAAIGRWVLFTFIITDDLNLNTFTVVTREGGSKPIVAINLTRGT